MQTEEWRVIKDYEGLYEVSNHGRVRSIRNNMVMRPWSHYKGHLVIYLGNKGRKKFFVHRLVAVAFIPNPNGKEVVNHIDCDKKNNIVENLEWMTMTENTQYYFRTRGIEIKTNEIF